jgi:hypothetical protein
MHVFSTVRCRAAPIASRAWRCAGSAPFFPPPSVTRAPRAPRRVQITVHTFENQRYYVWSKWSDKLLPTDRPHWSDERGELHNARGFARETRC